MYRLLGGKLPVTALRVHHFSPRSNYSWFHLATLLCPPQRTMVVTYNRTESQGPRVKDGGKTAAGMRRHYIVLISQHILDTHSAVSNKTHILQDVSMFL